MNNQEVAKLIKSKESGLVEFKETFYREELETIGAFANTKGGNYWERYWIYSVEAKS